MFSLIITSTSKLIIFAIAVLTLLGCEQQTVAINPEHISSQELSEQLQQALSHADLHNQKNTWSITMDPLNTDSEQQTLILSGDRSTIAKAISIAKQLDIAHNYYLEIRNTPINTISTSLETMRILLHPEQIVTLGHIILMDGPWGELIEGNEKLLQLKLDSNLVLSIDIKNSQTTETSYYSGKHPMRLDHWLMAFNNSEMNQGKKIMTSRPKKQLWLRLVKASSQSEINLR
jgi:hypothetical protein